VTADPDALRTELREYGDRLREAQRENADAHDAIAVRLPAALEAGISKREIARLTGVGRPWIDKTLKRSEQD
jgi:hypothetical protein